MKWQISLPFHWPQLALSHSHARTSLCNWIWNTVPWITHWFTFLTINFFDNKSAIILKRYLGMSTFVFFSGFSCFTGCLALNFFPCTAGLSLKFHFSTKQQTKIHHQLTNTELKWKHFHAKLYIILMDILVERSHLALQRKQQNPACMELHVMLPAHSFIHNNFKESRELKYKVSFSCKPIEVYW